MMFIGSKHCPRCGAAAVVAESTDLQTRLCPRCRIEMQSVVIGVTTLRECSRCDGLWVDVRSFEKICADREQQSAVLGTASPVPTTVAETSKINYVPCPECSQLMNRINFARCSGVIVDVCKHHGTWFDYEELSRIIEFIRDGGLDASRAKEKVAIAEEREMLRQEQRSLDMRRSRTLGPGDHDDHRVTGIASTRDLLKILLD
jgi:Zn-finger nucleic acid-binding protein